MSDDDDVYPGLSELGGAVLDGDLARVRALIAAGHAVGPEDAFGGTTLHVAVTSENCEIIAALFDAGALSFVDALADRQTPLGLAVGRGSRDVVRLLLSLGASIDARNEWGDTPLCEAVDHGHADIVDDLLAAGADPRGPGSMNVTALERARRDSLSGRNAVRQRIREAVERAAARR